MTYRPRPWELVFRAFAGATLLLTPQACSSEMTAGVEPGAMETVGSQLGDPPGERADDMANGPVGASEGDPPGTNPMDTNANDRDDPPDPAIGSDAAAPDPGGEGAGGPPTVTTKADASTTNAGDAQAPNAPADLTGVEALVCDGEPGITFAGRMLVTGLTAPGSGAMTENGFRFLIVEGNCRYWVQSGKLERVVSGRLTGPQLRELREALLLDDWQALAGDYPIGFPGAPDVAYVLGRGGLQSPCGPDGPLGGCIHVGGSGANGAGDLSPLHTAFAETLERLRNSGNEVQGDIRYLLVRGSGILPDQVYANPAGWPLGDPDDVAIDGSEINQTGYVPGTTRLATGTDAEQLRALWQRFIAYDVSGRFDGQPASGSEAIPIEVGGTRYHVFVRDSLPLEDRSGLIPYHR